MFKTFVFLSYLEVGFAVFHLFNSHSGETGSVKSSMQINISILFCLQLFRLIEMPSPMYFFTLFTFSWLAV